MLLNSDFLKKIRRIQITTSRMVSDVFAGQYHSIFKGRGIEFEEVREYQPGDEIRSIDWNVTARTGHPYIKKFVEERELTVMILLDVSASSFFGTVNQLKSQLASEISSVLAYSAIRNNDKVGLLAFSDKIDKFLPARKGTRYILRIIREALFYSSFDAAKAGSKKTDIKQALNYLNRVTKRKSVVFIISDFFSFKDAQAKDDVAFDFKKELSVTNKRHDVIALTLTDPRELELPDAGLIRLEDAETKNSFLLDSSNSKIRDAYRKKASKLLNYRKDFFKALHIDHIDIRTDIPYNRALIKFFKERERRLR